MEQRQHSGIEDRLYELVRSRAPEELADAIQDEVEKLLRVGYPRDVLYEDLGHFGLELRSRGRGDLEDEVLEVMDVLVGWCAPSARL